MTRLGVMGERDAVALGAGREATGNRDRAFDAHVRHVGILAGSCDLAEDEERTIGFDLDRHGRLADIAVAQFGGDLGGQSRRRSSARGNRADQGHGDRAAGVDRIGVGETFLAEHHDAQLVAGIEMIGRIVADGDGSGGVGVFNRRVSAARRSLEACTKRTDRAAGIG